MRLSSASGVEDLADLCTGPVSVIGLEDLADACTRDGRMLLAGAEVAFDRVNQTGLTY